jgi:DNA-binding response OmpR family regulator
VVTAGGDLRIALAIADRALAEAPTGRRGTPAYSRMLAHQALALARAYEGDLAGARGHVAAALELSATETAQRIDTLLVRAEVELCGGDLLEALRAASIARNHYTACRSRYCEAYACVVLAAGHAAHGGPGDLALAEEALARAGALAAGHGFEALRLRAILVRAAVLCRKRDRTAAELLLTEVLAHGGIRSTGLELLFASALGSQRDHELPAGLAAGLAVLGLRQPAAPEPEVVVDVAHATIATRRVVVKGRSIACALLACLVDARGQMVPAEVLYRAAWGASEYHPLRHRNTLYVALKRLRTTLAELCGHDRGELIETAPGGWRLVAGVVARKAN